VPDGDRIGSTLLANDAPRRFAERHSPGKGVRSMARETGTVARFMDDKGFGFIQRDSGGSDVFVHHSAIQGSGFKSLAQGDRVEFEVQEDAKGPRAANVTRVDE
jgi:cold shock protein